MKKTILLSLALTVLGAATVKPQATIGSLDPPEAFSVLELASRDSMGLRLPQMNTADRDGMTLTTGFQSEIAGLAAGLLIFNTDTGCIEFWNGAEWIPLCGKRICGAFVAPGVWKMFMCHNLGADESSDPFVAAQGLHGAMYKFGVKNAALSAAGNIANSGNDANWSTAGGTPPPSGDWNMATANPCPAGFRIPTVAEWQGVLDGNLNPKTPQGSWSGSDTNWNTGASFGDALFLPAAGRRADSNGSLLNRGSYGFYWSSTDGTNMEFSSPMYGTANINDRATGMSVRCVAGN